MFSKLHLLHVLEIARFSFWRPSIFFFFFSFTPSVVRDRMYRVYGIRSGERSKPFMKLFQAGVGEKREPGRSRTKRSLVVLRNRITRRLRNDAQTEGWEVAKGYNETRERVFGRRAREAFSFRAKTSFIPLHLDIFNCLCLLHT